MKMLSLIFATHAATAPLTADGALADSGADNGAETTTINSTTASETEQAGHHTLEYTDNPFESFMRKLDKVMDLDPQEALHMARNALTDNVFEGKMAAKLSEKMEAIMAEMHRTGSLSHTFSCHTWNQPAAACFASPHTPEIGAPARAPSLAPQEPGPAYTTAQPAIQPTAQPAAQPAAPRPQMFPAPGMGGMGGGF